MERRFNSKSTNSRPSLPEPPCVFHVPVSCSGEVGLQFCPYLTPLLCGYASPQGARWYDCALQNNSACGDDCVFPYDRVIEHHRIHPNECSSLDVGSVDRGVVTNACPIFQNCLAFTVRAVDHSTVLYVHAFANGDGSDIASNYTVEPTR